MKVKKKSYTEYRYDLTELTEQQLLAVQESLSLGTSKAASQWGRAVRIDEQAAKEVLEKIVECLEDEEDEEGYERE
jgi:hypothetical protein